MSKIGIINYGVGNLKSVKNSLDYLNIPNSVINEPREISAVDRIILPGVGAFGSAIEKLNNLGFAEEIKKFANSKKPILGICLGMQILLEKSCEYGNHNGLGLIKGNVFPFNDRIKNLPIPLIGWNEIKKEKPSPMLQNIDNESCFYFVHSYFCEMSDGSDVLATSEYGIRFASIIGNGNVFGCQFHPEKSQASGLQILKNFSNI